MEQFHVTPVDEPKKKISKKSVILIVIAILLLIGSVGAASYFAYQTAAANSKITQLNADKAKLNMDITKLKADHVAQAVGNRAVEEAPKNANNLTEVIDEIYQNPVDLTSIDKSTVMEVAKKHFKTDTAPDGATVLVGYEMVKPGTATSGEVRALVYWPGTDTQRPQFLDVVKDAGQEIWRADESY